MPHVRRPSQGERERAAAARQRARLAARHDALQLMADTPAGVSPAQVLGRDVGLLVGLEVDGLARRLPERSRAGDLVFVITEAGRAALADAKGLL